jgi:hypothetical protein
MSSLINLNVGGTAFSTTLSTLCSDSNSVLAAMFDPDRSAGRAPAMKDPNIYLIKITIFTTILVKEVNEAVEKVFARAHCLHCIALIVRYLMPELGRQHCCLVYLPSACQQC